PGRGIVLVLHRPRRLPPDERQRDVAAFIRDPSPRGDCQGYSEGRTAQEAVSIGWTSEAGECTRESVTSPSRGSTGLDATLDRHAGAEASAAITGAHCNSSRQWTGRATQCPATQWTVMYAMGPSVLLFTTKRAVTSPGWLQPDVKQGTKSLMGRLLASRIGAFSSVATLSSGIPSRGARRRIV